MELKIPNRNAYNGLVAALEQYVTNEEERADIYGATATDKAELAEVRAMLDVLNGIPARFLSA